MPYFVDEVYQGLLAIMTEAELGTEFAAFFTKNEKTGFWDCNDVTAYTNWLGQVFGDEPHDDFLAWGGYEQIKSTQGGGTF